MNNNSFGVICLMEGRLTRAMYTTRSLVGALMMTFLLAPVLGEDCQAYIDHCGKAQPAKSCPYFCCGHCVLQYCCSNAFLKFNEQQQLWCNLFDGRTSDSSNVHYTQSRWGSDDDISSGPRI
ncbi:uncharacterized protein AAGF69_010522 isoform 1-T1 [Amazona ochrocephala]